ncbi:hypothetical protein KC19_8G106300 [Ceratodon purpureus]|uniref:Uncharacterized protein n=1 Tax=Ceratodon purpureus TaxID=3225 RepID=A0A8T0GX88_CERPU|nr:hypothetical protein KC19_8G106300 [Ceratodon purpureus]
MALVCPNPRERLGPATTVLPGAVGACTHYVDLPGFRNTSISGGESRMTDHHHHSLRNPCHSCSEAGGRDDRRVLEAHIRGSQQVDDHAGSSHLPDLDFTVGSKWNSNSIPPSVPISSWSSYMTSSSGSFPTSSTDWAVPSLGAPFPGSDVASFHADLGSGLSPNNFSGGLPLQIQAGSSGGSFFASGQVQQMTYQNQQTLINTVTPRDSWEKIEDAAGPSTHQHQMQMPAQYENPMHGSSVYTSYGAGGQSAREDVKDQFATMDEDSVSQWVDVMITEMMEAMPGVPIEHLFTNLSEVLAPCNVQIERVIGSRFQSLFGAGAPGVVRSQNLIPPPGPSRAGKRSRDKCDVNAHPAHNADQWGSLRNVDSPRTSTFHAAGARTHVMGSQSPAPPQARETELLYARSQTNVQTIDNLQLSLEPADERNLRHLHSADQFAHQVHRDSPKLNSLHHQYHHQHQQQQSHQLPHHRQLGAKPVPTFPHDFTSTQSAVAAQYPSHSVTRGYQGIAAPSISPHNAPEARAAPRIAPRPQTEAAVSNVSDEEGLQLLALLLQCAEAVSADNYEEANTILPQLSELATPYGTSVQRVVAYFAEGMASRLVTSCLGMCSPLPGKQLVSNQNFVSAIQVFNEICPFVKFSHFTANQAITEAFEGMNNVHIIDIDIMHGLQWPGLFHILAKRPGGPPHVHITGLGTSVETLEATGKRLIDFAASLRISFEFTAVADKIGNVDPASLKVEYQDALAVHWMHHSLYDVTGSDPETLSLIQKLAPKVITVVEQDLRHGGTFLSRFVEALHYYSALFDSLGASYPSDSAERHMVEQQLLSCEIKNILAVGGPARTGQVKFEHWLDELSKAGFKPVPLSGKAAHQAALLLGLYPCEGYTLLEHRGTLKLGWKDLCLFTASAWTCE